MREVECRECMRRRLPESFTTVRHLSWHVSGVSLDSMLSADVADDSDACESLSLELLAPGTVTMRKVDEQASAF